VTLPGWTRRWWALALLCVVASFALRAPGFVHHVFDGDEAYVVTQAQVLRHGGDLYTDAVDRKPPLLPYAAAGLAAAGFDPLVGMRVLAAFAHAAAALCLAMEAGRRFGRRSRAPVAVGYLLAVAAFPPGTAEAASGETFVVAGVALAVALAARRRWWLAGIAFALALLSRQTAAFFVPVVALTAWAAAGEGERFFEDAARRVLVLVRLAIPTVVAFPVAAALLGWHDFWFWVGGGASGNYVSLPHDWDFALQQGRGAGIALLVALAGVWCLLAVGVDRARRQADLWVWLLCGIASVVIGFRFLEHYDLQVLPPLVLLAGAGWAGLRRAPGKAVVVVMALVPVTFWLPAAWNEAFSGAPLPEVASWVHDHSSSTDRILIWGSIPELYGESGRLPATRFVTSGFLTGHNAGRPEGDPTDQPVAGAWAMFRHDVSVRRPAMIVDTARAGVNGYGEYQMRQYPALVELLSHYRVAATIDEVEIYVPR
jgi:hypothetical protein